MELLSSLGELSRKSFLQLKALLEQQEYEDMRNTSWADLMEEVTKSKSGSQSERDEEVAIPKTQLIESGCVILNSDEKYPSLSIAVKQSDMERRETSTSKKRQGTKFR